MHFVMSFSLKGDGRQMIYYQSSHVSHIGHIESCICIISHSHMQNKEISQICNMSLCTPWHNHREYGEMIASTCVER